MKKVIQKFPLYSLVEGNPVIEISPRIQAVGMPEGAIILSLTMQNGLPFLYAIVSPEAKKGYRYFEVLKTGDPLPEGMPGPRHLFRETILLSGGDIVLHFFEKI